jgi:hypothetical protein
MMLELIGGCSHPISPYDVRSMLTTHTPQPILQIEQGGPK